MRTSEQRNQIFSELIENMADYWKQKATVTQDGAWTTIVFGTLITVKGRGRNEALDKLENYLSELERDATPVY